MIELETYKDAPWPDENIVFENENIVVYKDGYPVTEGHLLFVPKRTAVSHSLDIMRCFEMAYRQGTEGVENGKWDAFNVGINNGVAAGQSVMWPHVHLIPRREGDTPNPKGGVRNVIPLKGNYEDTTEDDWENEGGMFLPHIDDNSSREELDTWKERYKGYSEYREKLSEYHFFRGKHGGCLDDRDWDRVKK